MLNTETSLFNPIETHFFAQTSLRDRIVLSHSHVMCIGLFNPKICTCASNFGGRFPQLKYSMTIKLTFGSFDFSFKMNMNSKSKRFSYLEKLNTRERL